MYAATAFIRQIDTVRCIYLPDICSCFVFTSALMHTVTPFHYFTVTVRAESVGGSTPGVRVTWNTTVPPECVTSARVEFRTASHGFAVATYTQLPQIIQTGLRCSTNYYIRVVYSYWTPMC